MVVTAGTGTEGFSSREGRVGAGASMGCGWFGYFPLGVVSEVVFIVGKGDRGEGDDKPPHQICSYNLLFSLFLHFPYTTLFRSAGLVMVDIEERWVVVMVQGSRWHWGEGGQHWSCMGWTCFIGSSCSNGVSE